MLRLRTLPRVLCQLLLQNEVGGCAGRRTTRLRGRNRASGVGVGAKHTILSRAEGTYAGLVVGRRGRTHTVGDQQWACANRSAQRVHQVAALAASRDVVSQRAIHQAGRSLDGSASGARLRSSARSQGTRFAA